MPARRLSVGLLNDTGLPSSRISPRSGCSAPVRHLISVDLPAPLSPMIPRTSPALSTRSTSARPITCPNVLTRPRASSTCVALAGEPWPDEALVGSFPVLPVGLSVWPFIPLRSDVSADHRRGATPPRPAKDVVDHQVDGENGEHAVDQVQRPNLERVAGPVEDVWHLRRLGRLAL